MSSPLSPNGSYRPDYVQINAGGRIFSCSKNTLTSSSGYFSSLFSRDWRVTDEDEGGGVDETYFMDQDPDAFQVLLSYMRNGFIHASVITESVLMQAEFLGIDSLLRAVRCAAYRYLHNHHSQLLSQGGDEEEETCRCFDEKYGGIVRAIQRGILPQFIQPSVRGHKEFAHLGISNDTVVMPTDSSPGKESLPCLMTKLILPGSNEDADVGAMGERSDTIRESSSPSALAESSSYCFPTLIESLNWLHRNGFLETEDDLLHFGADIFDQSPVDPRIIHLLSHTWFSRRVVKNKESRSKSKRSRTPPYWESPILYQGPGRTNNHQSKLDRREFAALVSLFPEHQHDHMKREFVVAPAEATTATNLKVMFEAEEVGVTVVSHTRCIHAHPVQWLAAHGYTRPEAEYSQVLQQLYRDGSSKVYLWDNETISRIHVRVFSRDLVE